MALRFHVPAISLDATHALLTFTIVYAVASNAPLRFGGGKNTKMGIALNLNPTPPSTFGTQYHILPGEPLSVPKRKERQRMWKNKSRVIAELWCADDC